MRTFDVFVRLEGKALHFYAIGRSSSDIVCECMDRFFSDSESISLSVFARS